MTSILVTNLKYQSVYNTITNFNKVDLYKSKEVELAKLDQLNKNRKKGFTTLHNTKFLPIFKISLLYTLK